MTVTDFQEDNLKKWVKALRSGEFLQGRGVLKHVKHEGDTLMCCLGVACDISEGHRLVPSNDEGRRNSGFWADPITDGESMPHNEWFLDYYGIGPGIKGLSYFAQLNDIEHFTFEEIADYIEDCYLT